MRPITDRAKKVALSLPESWTQREEFPGSDVYFEGTPKSGVFRFMVLDVASEDAHRSSETIRNIIGGDDYQTLSDGIHIRHHLRRIREHGTSGTPLHMYFWEVLIPEGVSAWLLVKYSLTFVATRDDETAKEKIRQIDSVVRSARYATSSARSWWQFWR